MSLILDALKKLEQDKAARRARQNEIRPALTGVKGDSAVPRWRLPLLMAIAVVLAVVVTVSVMGGFSRTKGPAAALQEASRLQPAPEPSPPAPVVPASPPSAAPMPQPAAAPLPTPVPGTASAVPVRPKAPEPVSTIPAPADLRVTGIAWQDERKARRAVVNGTLASEGADVSGARIVEIHQDKVRFSRDGATFVVPITSAFTGK